MPLRTQISYLAVALLLTACAPPGQGSVGFRDIDWPRADQIMSASDNREIEILLNQLGYLRGGLDGQIGTDTRAAIRRYQTDIGAPATGFVSQPLLFSLRANAPASASVPAAATSAPTATMAPAPRQTTSAATSTGPTTRSVSGSNRDSGGGGSSRLGGGSGGAWN